MKSKQANPASLNPTIYFDLSTSMIWAGNVEGIIRAELEFARNIYELNPNIRFAKFDENLNDFVDVTEEVIPWAINSGNIIEGYNERNKLLRSNELNEASSLSDSKEHNQDETKVDGLDSPLEDPEDENEQHDYKTRSLENIDLAMNQIQMTYPARRARLGVLREHVNVILPPVIYKTLKATYRAKPTQYIKSKINDYLVNRSFDDKTTHGAIVANVGSPLSKISALDGRPILTTAGFYSDKRYFAAVSNLRVNCGFLFVALIYDLTPRSIPETHHESTIAYFNRYFKFCSSQCDLLIYGGNTAQEMGIEAQEKENLRIPPSAAIQFGSQIAVSKISDKSSRAVPKEIKLAKINEPFLLCVGTLQPRKNQYVLYTAYIEWIRTAKNLADIPQLVLVGRNGWKADSLIELITRDPRVKDKIIWVNPSDDALDWLYKNCLFTLLPTIWEGWSLTLPESLSYHKFCLASDVAPLREIADGIVEFVDPYDPIAWKERMEFYVNNPKARIQMEKQINRKWYPTSWKESAQSLLNALGALK